MKTLYEVADVTVTVPVTLYAADAATNGTTIDLGARARGYRSALLVAVSGDITDGEYTITIQHSDNGSAWSAVPADKLQGEFATITDSQTTQAVGYHGGKRYLRAVSTAAETESGGTVGVLVLPGFPTSG